MEMLIKIDTQRNPDFPVSAKDLYLFLSIDNGRHFQEWSNRNIIEGFDQGFDYQTYCPDGRSRNIDQGFDNQTSPLSGVKSDNRDTLKNKSNPNHRPLTDYLLTMDCAKEVAMMSRCENGRTARKYFIAVEKDWRKNNSMFAGLVAMDDNGREMYNFFSVMERMGVEPSNQQLGGLVRAYRTELKKMDNGEWYVSCELAKGLKGKQEMVQVRSAIKEKVALMAARFVQMEMFN